MNSNYCRFGTKVLGTAATEIFQMDGIFNQRAISVINYGPGSLANCIVRFSLDGANFGTMDGTGFGALGSTAIAYGWYDSPIRYLQAWGAAVSGSVATVVFGFNQ